MKHCNICHTTKPRTDFHKRAASIDGLAARCRECQRAYDRARKDDPHREQARKEYARTAAGKAAGGRAKKEWRDRNTTKARAHAAVGYAMRSGKLFKKPCEKCGTSDAIHAHHDDYAEPLNIRWLCAAHHTQWHAEHGEALNP